jgi:hypothetical protein
VLSRATDRFSQREAARIVRLTEEALHLETEHFEPRRGDQVFLNFELEGRPYFFAVPRRRGAEAALELEWPAVIYEAERRDRDRRGRPRKGFDPERVTLRMGAERAAADVVDWSPGGLGVRAPDRPGLEPGARLEVRPLDGAAPRRPLHGRVRSRRPSGEPDGWIRLGLELSADPWPEPIPVESRKRILGESSGQPVVAMGGSAQPVGSPSLQPRVVRYANEQGEAVCGIVDVFGEAHGAPAVVIPSAWGRTKETLLPLAHPLRLGAHQGDAPPARADDRCDLPGCRRIGRRRPLRWDPPSRRILCRSHVPDAG